LSGGPDVIITELDLADDFRQSEGSQTELMATRRELRVPDGRTLVVHDTGPSRASDELALIWHNGSPHTGALLEPVVSAAAQRSMRVVTYARPSYGGSTPNRGREVAPSARDVEQIVDALAIPRFVTMGYSGGGPPALACAALLVDRVIAAVTLSSIAPYTDSFDWYAGMAAPGGLRAASQGREARERFALTDEFDRDSFIERDWQALDGTWKALGEDAVRAETRGSEGLVDDDLSATASWHFDPAQITIPVLVVQGGEDRVIPWGHGDWLMRTIPTAEYWFRPRDGHVSILNAVPVAMDWLRDLTKGA
jgi:pimeloyl-ACP methyl ester carboxylesterase